MESNDPLGLVGTTIDDKYVVEAMVGEGGFAVVYRATHKLWQRPVALKCFKTLMDASPRQREQLLHDFIQEGALLSDLSARSATIVQARDVGTFTTASGAWIPYMVLEWLEGEALDGIMGHLGGDPLAVDQAMSILEPIAVALEVAHARHIAHRDVKPANVFVVGAFDPHAHVDVSGGRGLVRSDGVLVKLLDFGIAKVVESAAERGFTKTTGIVTSFTPAYGAPEQFSRAQGATGPWTDVYAFALIFSELVTGRAALEGDDFIQLGCSSADSNRRPTPRTLGVDLGDAIESVMLKALAVRPAERFQSAGELWNALRASVGEAPLRVGATQRPPGDARSGGATGRTAGTSDWAAATAVAPDGAGAAVQPVLTGRIAPPRAGDPSTLPKVSFDTPSTPPSPQRSRAPWILAVVAVGALVVGGGAFALFGGQRGAREGGTSQASSGPLRADPAAPVTTSSAAASAPLGPGTCPAEMAMIPGGKFFMGADDGEADEKPAHNVTLAPYCIDLHEVTVAAYKACSDHGECKRASAMVDWPRIEPRQKKLYSPLCNVNAPEGRADHPVNCVDWDLAVAYCEAKGGRLPTEAEWEFAARGPDGRIYPWGDEPPDETRLNACGSECVEWGKQHGEPLKPMYAGSDGFPNTAPVARFPRGASRYGLLDVVGNVWEWTADWHAPYGGAPQVDPRGPSKGDERVVRGGAWNGSFASWVRPTQRYSFPPQTKSHAVGFRCARSVGK